MEGTASRSADGGRVSSTIARVCHACQHGSNGGTGQPVHTGSRSIDKVCVGMVCRTRHARQRSQQHGSRRRRSCIRWGCELCGIAFGRVVAIARSILSSSSSSKLIGADTSPTTTDVTPSQSMIMRSSQRWFMVVAAIYIRSRWQFVKCAVPASHKMCSVRSGIQRLRGQ